MERYTPGAGGRSGTVWWRWNKAGGEGTEGDKFVTQQSIDVWRKIARLFYMENKARLYGPRSALTLMELLVVIAIVGVLAALLFPVLSKIRASGQRAACAANMRQTGFYLLSLIQENDGVIPLASDPTSEPRHRDVWSERLIRHYNLVPPAGIFHCPARTRVRDAPNWRRPDYGMNYFWGNPDQPERRTTLVAEPSRTMLLAESEGPKQQAVFYVLSNDRHDVMDHAWHDRHQTGMHFFFFDGSVQFRTEKWPDDPTDVFWSRPY